MQIENLVKDEPSAPYNRSKLIVVGEGRAGKTSTIKSLMNKPFDPVEESTKGFNIDTIDTVNWEKALGRPFTDQISSLLIENHPPVHDFAKKKPDIPTEDAAAEDDLNDNQPVQDAIDYKKSGEKDVNSNQPVVETEEVISYGEEFFNTGNTSKGLGFTIWDFGGQKVFYSQHHLFLTQYACYLLLFSLKKILDQNQRYEALSYLGFWLNSIRLHAPAAPVMLVGSHADCIKSEKEFKVVNDILEKELLADGFFNDFGDTPLNFFPVDNTNKMGIVKLKQAIENIVQGSDYIKTLVPLSFLRLLELLLNGKAKYLPIEKAFKEMTACGLDEKSMYAAVRFLNERGMICYFPKPEILSNIIILQPQWLIEALTTVLYDPSHHKHPEYNPVLKPYFGEFVKKRTLKADLLQDMWTRKGFDPSIHGFLINLMLQTMLMCEFKWRTNQQYFLVPALYETFETKGKTDYVDVDFSGPFFAFDFSGEYGEADMQNKEKTLSFLPFGFFERLTCAAIAVSSSYKETTPPEISLNSAVVSFGVELLVQLTSALDEEGRELHLLVKSETDTDVQVLAEKIEDFRALVDKLNTDFFSRHSETTRLDIRLLIPSTDGVLAEYDQLRAMFEEDALKDRRFFVKKNKNRKRAAMFSFKQWFQKYLE